MKKLLFLLPLFLVSCSTLGLSSGTLNSKNTQNLQVNVRTVEQFEFVGLTGYNPAEVKDINTEIVGDTFIIKLMTAPVSESSNGNFSIDIPLPAGINKVALSKKSDVIWTR